MQRLCHLCHVLLMTVVSSMPPSFLPSSSLGCPSLSSLPLLGPDNKTFVGAVCYPGHFRYDQEYYKYKTIKLRQQKPIQNHKIVRRNWARVLFCLQRTATSCPHSPATGSLKTCSTAPRRTRNSSKRCRLWFWSPTGWLEAPSLPGTRSSSPVDHSSFTTAAPSMDLVPQISKVLFIVAESDCEWPGSLYEQAGPAEVSILPDNPWDGCGDKKR